MLDRDIRLDACRGVALWLSSSIISRGISAVAAFLLLTLFLVVAVYWIDPELADDANVMIVLQQPGEALSRAAILQYRPVNTDVLPAFVLFQSYPP
jgi:hypothetical protein